MPSFLNFSFNICINLGNSDSLQTAYLCNDQWIISMDGVWQFY